jgi:acetoin:2,6-dichlorophenolindophenol oxidoreductase subunit beta
MSRQIKYFEAIREALDFSLSNQPNAFIMGLGATDPKGVFGTTLGLQKKYGKERVMDMPTSENGMTGVAVGAAMMGMRPIMVHQRVDFILLAMDQIVNNAAKWHYMSAGGKKIPLVIRLVIGRGWGQGAQHSQCLHSWFTHVPGLKVVMPSSPYDAKGLLIASIEDNNPVIFLEHRWLHNTFGDVPEESYRVPLGRARIAKAGSDISIIASSHMVIEALDVAQQLSKQNISAEVVDLRTLRPLDEEAILESVAKTGHVMVLDPSWKFGGFSGEVVSLIVEKGWKSLKSAPARIALADCPIPTSQAISTQCYPNKIEMTRVACEMLKEPFDEIELINTASGVPHDVPDSNFRGPF